MQHYTPWPPAPQRKNGRPRSTNPNSSTAKGYGTGHKARRAALAPIVAEGGTRCVLCGERILPGARWHLAHADDPVGSPPGTAHKLGLYAGPSHSACNSAVNRRRIKTPKPAGALDIFNTTNAVSDGNPSDNTWREKMPGRRVQ